MSTLDNGDKEFIEESVANVLRRLTFKFLVSVISLLAVQFAAGVWWASSVTHEVADTAQKYQILKQQADGHDTRFNLIEATRYKDRDAQKDFALRDQRILSLEQSMGEIKGAIVQISREMGEITAGIRRLEDKKQ